MIIFKKHNRFHFFNFFFVIRHSSRMREIKEKRDKGIKKDMFFYLFFRTVFRAYESVEMCF